MSRIGFMQGRLSALVDGRIQAFPWADWRQEFPAAAALGLSCMEWTLDHDSLAENPLMTAVGRAEILALSARHGVGVPSLTGDCFMQAPFWKASGAARAALLRDFSAVVAACGAIGIRMVVVPLVDNGALATTAQREALAAGLAEVTPLLRDLGVAVLFESDFAPAALAAFIAGYPADCFGINYDTGNSASLGWDPAVEIAAFGGRIGNVHVKDRVLGGTTVPLGQGAADFGAVFRRLNAMPYRGHYILQTARAADGDHAGVLAGYRDFVAGWLEG